MPTGPRIRRGIMVTDREFASRSTSDQPTIRHGGAVGDELLASVPEREQLGLANT